ncbi:QacE [Erwinia typographi]|uniref:QacE n=2 Tax=Erwinia typographi TaxID=371042 RepID=A0A0A3YNY4_9GAMM|nr:QacE [Erwinia typographi]
MEEKEFYSNGKVSITNSRFLVGSTTYAMNGVTSVKRGERPPSKAVPAIIVLTGLIMIFAASTLMFKGIGVLLIVLGIMWIKSLKTEYVVFLNSASGESQALTSTDKNYIDKVINSLNEAIIYRG